MRILLSFAVCLSSLACFSDEGRQFRLPTAPGDTLPPTANPSPNPTPSPTPAPLPFPTPRPPMADDFVSMTVGERFSGRVSSNPPDCLGFPGWPCQYFRLTPEANGVLTVELTYQPQQQPGQGVDVTIENSTGAQIWADRWAPGAVSARAPVSNGERLQIVLWYTFPGLEYEVVTALAPR